MIEARVDPVLFGLSRDYVGDTAETIALIWPGAEASVEPPRLDDIVQELEAAPCRGGAGACCRSWLDRLDATERWALLKLLTGALRVGVSARLAKTGARRMVGQVPLAEIEEVWHGLAPALRRAVRLAFGDGPSARDGRCARPSGR